MNIEEYDYCSNIEKEVEKEDGKVQVAIEELFKYLELDHNIFNSFDIAIWNIIKDEKVVDITTDIYNYLVFEKYVILTEREYDNFLEELDL